MEQISGIVFDLDGVLINSEPVHAFAWINALKNNNIEVDETSIRNLVGVSDDLISKNMVEEYRLLISSEKLLLQKKLHFIKLLHNQSTLLFPGLKESLKLIKHLPLGIATSSSRELTSAILENEGILNYFNIIIGEEDVKNYKPSPEPYLRATEKLQIAPKDCIAVEDSVMGIESAKKSGMKVCAVATSFVPNFLSEADYIFGTTAEAINFINKKFLVKEVVNNF